MSARGVRVGRAAAGFLALVALVALVAHAGPSYAQERAPRAQLAFVRGAGAARCGDEAAFRDAVRARLGRDPFDAESSARIELTLRREGSALSAELRLTDATGAQLGRRTLRARGLDCAPLLASTAVAATVALEALPPEQPRAVPAPASAPARVAAPAVEPIPVPAPAPVPVPPPPPPGVARPSPAPRPAVLLALGLTGAVGTHPSASIGGELAAGVRWRSLSGAVGVRADVPSSATFALPARTGVRAASTWVALTVRACGHWRWFAGCGLWSSGSFGASGSGLDVNRTGAVWAHYAGLGAHFAYPERGVLRVRARLEGFASVLGPQLVAGGSVVWTAPPVHGTLGFDALVEF